MMRNKTTPVEIQGSFYPLNQIYVYLTRSCNLRCRHCWIAPQYQASGQAHEVLDFALFRSIVDKAKPLGLAGVKLTGGEPLIHPQVLEILRYTQTQDISLTVETNGVRCSLELAREIKACKSPSVSVSLDGADAQTHEWMRGVKGCFDETVTGIRNLVRAGLGPQIIMSIVQRNKDQMQDVVKLAESLGASSVKFNPVQPIARGLNMHEAGETLSIEELVVLGQWVESEFSALNTISVRYSHPPAFRPLSRILGPSGDGCHSCGILGILGVLADGSYALCGIGETVPDLILGHAAQTALETVWTNSPLLQEIREGLPNRMQGICGECLMKNRCLGSCIAQNYYDSKNLWAPYWYCREARMRGLFPKSRVSAASPVDCS